MEGVAAARSLSGRSALVTGASSGIGRAIAVCLASRGARLALMARRLDRLKEFEVEVAAKGIQVISVQGDVSDAEQVFTGMRRVMDKFGEINILVNCAGVMFYTHMENCRLNEWHQQIDVNCKGVVNCIAAVLPSMVEKRSGHIVNISSDAGKQGFAGLAVYSGSKFFVEGLSQAMRKELSRYNIKVTTVQPGDCRTELLSHNTDKEALEEFDSSGQHPILDPVDVANAVLFAIEQPAHSAVNEILIEPKDAPI